MVIIVELWKKQKSSSLLLFADITAHSLNNVALLKLVTAVPEVDDKMRAGSS